LAEILLDITANLGLAFQQEFVFDPDNVKVTMSVEGQPQQEGFLNDTNTQFKFQVPSQGSGVVTVKAKYELFGQVKNNISPVIQGLVDVKAIQLSFKGEALGLAAESSFGPLLQLKFPENGLELFNLSPLVGSSPSKPTDPDPVFEILKAIDTNEISGTELDEKNPAPNATKNLVVETEYKIPYGVPLSISDAASITEGTEETNGGASRQSQAYFTYNGKYYEWQPRIVQPFTGSGGDVLSRISLETLGDASPNAYNFIAFQNNIPDPNLIIAGSTIQVPKEVPLPDTTGYAVFQVSSSGASAKTNYNTANGTATAGSDYLAASGTLSIPGGQGGVILVPIIGDTEQEETETFTVTLTRSDGTPISEGVDKREAKGTINDDDDKPEPPENKAATYNDPHLVTFDGQYHDFQASGEFTLIDTPSGDLKIQVRQQPVGNNPTSNVSQNTAVATLLGGKRIALYKDTQQLFVDGVPTEIPNNNSLVVGDGRIYREGNIYTIVYLTGDQLAVTVFPNRVNLSVFLTEARQGQIQGLLGNFNGNLQDDLTKRDGTVLSEPVTPAQLYGEYADSWRITQAESLFDYKPGETTTTFTLPNFPIRKVTLADLNPADIAKAEERIGDSITDPTIREAAIIDYILTGFDDTIIEEAIASPIPERVLAIVVPPKAVEDFADTINNIPVTLDVLSNDTGTLGVTLLLADFNPTTPNGGTINRNDNGTSNDLSDDVLTYTPPANFVGTDRFNYTLSDGTQIAAGTVTIKVLEPIVIPLTAVEDIATTTTNTPVTLDVLSNDTGPLGVPLSIAYFDPTTTNGGNISRNDNGTPDNLSDDFLTYTPPANFVGRDRFNYTLSDGTQIAAGSVTIAISATPTPLISELDLATLNGSNGFAINGINPGDFSSIAVSGIGDFNRDGFDDVAVGAFGADPNGLNAAGETYLIYGSPAGFPANFNPSQLNGANGFILNGIDLESFSGGSLSRAGDFNGDGFDDLMVGAFASTVNGQEDAGKTYILFGTNQSVPTRFDLSQLNGSNGFVLSGQDEFDYVGIAVNPAGDINADSFDDLLIAAPGSLGGESGKTYILYGSSQNIPTNLTLADLEDASEELLTFTRGFQQPISAAISRGHIVVSGINSPPSTAVSGIGDVNGDGFDDVAVAPEPNEDNPISETYILFGSASGFGNLNLTELDSNNGFILTNLPPNANPSLGSAGDINNDGIDDFLLGVPEATVGNLANAGQTYVIFGTREGFGEHLDVTQLNDSNGFVLNGSEIDELAGSSVSAAGDINSDGIDDLIIGAAGATVNDLASAGKVYAVFGSETGFPASLNLAELDGSNGLVLKGANADDSTGISVSAAGDTNGDNIEDLIVGAPGNLFNNTPGKSYIVFGNPSYGIG
jgi:von Willebrand factor type D domain/Bacterial Ig domain/Calx-beta domain/FG-GAP repeat